MSALYLAWGAAVGALAPSSPEISVTGLGGRVRRIRDRGART